MTSVADEEQLQESRSECPVARTHRRFLLRQLEFTQQYAPIYRCRMAIQQDRAIAAVKRVVATADGTADASPSNELRVLELQPGIPAFSVGVVYKQMKLLPRFLDEYQRELVRIDAGDENDDDGDLGDDDEAPVAVVANGDLEAGPERAAADEHFSISHPQDELMLEDSSGRVTLQGLRATHFCTGLVVGIYGTLLQSGQVLVHRYAFADAAELYVPRPRLAAAKAPPCYVAFVCGLNVCLPELHPPAASGEVSPNNESNSTANNTSVAAVLRHRALLELFVDFISGATTDPVLLAKARCISRLVIGGNSIAPTDELRLKKKVRLDPSDHVRLSDDKANAGVITSAKLMRELDGVLERLAASVEVELMPGDNDMSDSFQPQQPLHPVLLPNAARYSTLRLVTNPFEFSALVAANGGSVKLEGNISIGNEEEEEQLAKKKKLLAKGDGHAPPPAPATAADNGVSIFVTSGQNVNDVARETKFSTHLEAMGVLLASGCACPTAPNTLFSYPFRDEDPFLFPRTPHCLVACDQPQFETRYASLEQIKRETTSYLNTEASATGTKAPEEEEEERDENTVLEQESRVAASGVPATRLVCVPSFARSGTVVLIDVNSPSLETTRVTFAVRGGADEKL